MEITLAESLNRLLVADTQPQIAAMRRGLRAVQRQR
jgi:hypothetical protein